jgi:trehalose 6-phosphate phosphatase
MTAAETSLMTQPIPIPQKNWALFLDMDGTLLDIADSPAEVIVPVGLLATLEVAEKWLDGALAIVSGRTLGELETLLSPLKLFLAAEHGAIFLAPETRLPRIVLAHPVPRHMATMIEAAIASWPGVFLEVKSYGVAVHFRHAPQRGEDVKALLEGLADGCRDFSVLPGRMVYELRHRQVNKGRAVAELMQRPPFSGRVPVFVGDDVTDEEGFREAERQNGIGLHVGEVFGGSPENVRRWLRCLRD